MIAKLKFLFKKLLTSEKTPLAVLISNKVEIKLKEIRSYLEKTEPQEIVCNEDEFLSGVETVFIADYILNWLKNAESSGMQGAESMIKMEEFKAHFESNDKGCAWKFSQALIGEYVQMHSTESNLYKQENLDSFMGAWMMRLCFGNEKKIERQKSGDFGHAMLQ